MKILAVDPGKNCGWAEIEFGGEVLKSGVTNYASLAALLSKIDRKDLTAVIAEDYIVYKSHAQNHTGSRLEVARALGTLEAYCHFNDLRFVKQPPYMYKVGAKFLGAQLPKGHLKDELSAIYHGIAYLKSIDQFETKLEASLKERSE